MIICFVSRDLKIKLNNINRHLNLTVSRVNKQNAIICTYVLYGSFDWHICILANVSVACEMRIGFVSRDLKNKLTNIYVLLNSHVSPVKKRNAVISTYVLYGSFD